MTACCTINLLRAHLGYLPLGDYHHRGTSARQHAQEVTSTDPSCPSLPAAAPGDFPDKVNTEIVAIQRIQTAAGEAQLRSLIAAHVEKTGSPKGKALLADWQAAVGRFWQLVPPSEQNTPEASKLVGGRLGGLGYECAGCAWEAFAASGPPPGCWVPPLQVGGQAWVAAMKAF